FQHVLRAFTPNDAKALKDTVKTYPKSEFYEIETLLTQLGIGQALITVLNEKGIPTEVAATHLTPPTAMMGPLPEEEYKSRLSSSSYFDKYNETLDSESAYELLSERLQKQLEEQEEIAQEKASAKVNLGGRKEKSTFEQILASPITKQIGKELVRGMFSMLLGSQGRRR
ncbi:MAG: DUF853 domain-containing protein, partial [Cytophagales bacterium]|nr:DUF853 domain-containing protein [Cytophagales bacterium]